MDAFSRLSRFGSTVKERAVPVWKSAAVHLTRVGSALAVGATLERGRQWLKPGRRKLWAAGISVVLVLLISSLIGGGASWYGKHHAALAPLLTLAAGLAVAAVALARHFGQTNADRQRRITESFSKAVEQLASDKLEVRLGGIYSLERISKESPDDYWTVMENLTAFVRERSRRNEAARTLLDFEQRVSQRAYFLWLDAGQPDGQAEENRSEAVELEKLGEPPGTDIAAVLTVIKRRSAQSRERERTNAWRLDLRSAVLKRADLRDARLERADLRDVHFEAADLGGAHLELADLRHVYLESANLGEARLEGANLLHVHFKRTALLHVHLEGANLMLAHLEGAYLVNAHLEGADLRHAHLERANIAHAHLERAILVQAHLEGVDLRGAHLEGAILLGTYLAGADLREAVGLSAAQLTNAHGDVLTRLPAGLARPAGWTELDPSVSPNSEIW